MTPSKKKEKNSNNGLQSRPCPQGQESTTALHLAIESIDDLRLHSWSPNEQADLLAALLKVAAQLAKGLTLTNISPLTVPASN